MMQMPQGRAKSCARAKNPLPNTEEGVEEARGEQAHGCPTAWEPPYLSLAVLPEAHGAICAGGQYALLVPQQVA